MMINTIIKNNNSKSKTLRENILNEIYLFPKWEMIKSFELVKHKFFSKNNSVNVDLFRRFSLKNKLEKYLIKTDEDKILAKMDLKIYKDCVYIINISVEVLSNFNELVEYMLQIAVEKALYDTSGKSVYINLSSGIMKNKIKKILINNEFLQADNQSDYEKELFGETFSIQITGTSGWMQKIKQHSVLLNK